MVIFTILHGFYCVISYSTVNFRNVCTVTAGLTLHLQVLSVGFDVVSYNNLMVLLIFQKFLKKRIRWTLLQYILRISFLLVLLHSIKFLFVCFYKVLIITTATNYTQTALPWPLMKIYKQASSKFNKTNFVIHLQLFKLKDCFGVVYVNHGSKKRSFSFKIFIYLFLERGDVREREKDRNLDVRQTLISCLSHVPNQGTWPATQACALNGN